MYRLLPKVIGERHEQLSAFKEYFQLFSRKIEQDERFEGVRFVTHENFNRALSQLNSKYLSVLIDYKNCFIALEDPISVINLNYHFDRLGNLIRLKAHEVLLDHEISQTEEMIRRNLKTEALLRIDQKTPQKIHDLIMSELLFKTNPQISEKIVQLVERGLIQNNSELESSHLHDLWRAVNEENKSKFAEYFIALINQATEQEVQSYFKDAWDAKVLLQINIYLEEKKVLAIKHKSFAADTLGVLSQRDFEGKMIGMLYDNYISLYESSPFRESTDSKKFIILNPDKEIIKMWINQMDLSPKTKNHIHFILNHVPKGTFTRDHRRTIGIYIFEWLKYIHLSKEAPLIMEQKEDYYINKKYVLASGISKYEKNLQAKIGFFKKVSQKRIEVLFAQLLENIDTRVQTAPERRDLALAFSALALDLINIGDELYELDLQPIFEFISGWQKKLNKKEILNAEKLGEITQMINTAFLECFLRVIPLTSKAKSALKKEWQNKDSSLNKEGRLLELFKYYAFQNEKGKEVTIKFMENLATNSISKDKLTEQSLRFAASNQDVDFSMKFLGIWNDIKIHLNIKAISKIKDKAIRNALKEIKKQLSAGQNISSHDLQNWKNLFSSDEFKKEFPSGAEALVNLEQIAIVQNTSAKRNNSSEELEIEITGDAFEILRAGDEPYRTCQRISGWTQYNDSGEPLYRAMHENIYLAKVTSSQNNEILGRAILEVVTSPPNLSNAETAFLNQTFGVNAASDIEKGILVERPYLLGQISESDFELQILKMLAKEISYDYAILSTKPSKIQKKVLTTKNPGDLPEGIYRDTFKTIPADKAYYALDLHRLRIIWMRNPNFNPFN